MEGDPNGHLLSMADDGLVQFVIKVWIRGMENDPIYRVGYRTC